MPVAPVGSRKLRFAFAKLPKQVHRKRKSPGATHGIVKLKSDIKRLQMVKSKAESYVKEFANDIGNKEGNTREETRSFQLNFEI